MAKKRIPFAATLNSRRPVISVPLQDSVNINSIKVKLMDGRTFIKPRRGVGTLLYPNIGSIALGIKYFNNSILSIKGVNFYSGSTLINSSMDATSLYQFIEIGQGGTSLFIKNNTSAYVWDGTTLTKVTDVNYPAITAPGVVFLDGYVFVVDSKGVVWNCNLNTPLVWNALNYISGGVTPSNSTSASGTGIAKLYNYVVCFTNVATYFFYDSGNPPPGSPLLQNQSATINVGAVQRSLSYVLPIHNPISESTNTVFFIGKNNQQGLSAYMFEGLSARVISDNAIDLYLNAGAGNNNFVCYNLKIENHNFFVITILFSSITLVYDLNSNTWDTWSTTLILGFPSSYSGIIKDGKMYVNTTFSLSLNKYVTSSLIQTSGTGDQKAFGIFPITVVDDNNFYYYLPFDYLGPSVLTGINLVSTSVFAGFLYTNSPTTSANYFADIAGNIYVDNPNDGFQNLFDGSLPVITYVRTDNLDFGVNTRKYFKDLVVIADRFVTTINNTVAHVCYTDDDFNTYSSPRPVNLNSARPQLRRLGSSRRRAFAMIYIGTNPVGYPTRFFELELDVESGTS